MLHILILHNIICQLYIPKSGNTFFIFNKESLGKMRETTEPFIFLIGLHSPEQVNP